MKLRGGTEGLRIKTGRWCGLGRIMRMVMKWKMMDTLAVLFLHG